jgi:glycoprotein-N-acetylgalactosamine 3-beta-galactosyltransferase
MENLKKYLSTFKELDPLVPRLLGHRMTLQWWELLRQFEWVHGKQLESMNEERRRIMQETLKETRPQGGLYYTPGGSGYAFNPAFLKVC